MITNPNIVVVYNVKAYNNQKEAHVQVCKTIEIM